MLANCSETNHFFGNEKRQHTKTTNRVLTKNLKQKYQNEIGNHLVQIFFFLLSFNFKNEDKGKLYESDRNLGRTKCHLNKLHDLVKFGDK